MPSLHREVHFETEICTHLSRHGTQYNENCKPFTWTATADSILEKIARL